MVLVRTLCLATALLAGAALAQPVVTAGVKYEQQADVRGSKLLLNGTGTRSVPFLGSYYTAGLYLTRKAGTPEEVTATPGPKRMSITALREIDSGDLGKRFTRGVEDNMNRGEMAKLVPGLIRMSQVFSDCKRLQPGDNFTIDWVPGTGTILTVNAASKCAPNVEPFKEPEFYNALLSIWLGKKPADLRLKDQLLGQQPAGPNTGQ